MRLQLADPPSAGRWFHPSTIGPSQSKAVYDRKTQGSAPPATLPTDSTASLLKKVRSGDHSAREFLFRRHLSILRTWARGRLPRYARESMDTEDLVQVTMVRALERLNGFESRHAGAFLAYLRKTLFNQIRDQIRHAIRMPKRGILDDNMPASGPSPLEDAIGSEAFERYERAIRRLPPGQQEAIVLRVEAGLTYPEIAHVMGRPTANAARLLVSRAMLGLVRGMRER